MIEMIQGFLVQVFTYLGSIFSGLISFLTFNPLASLPNPVNVGVIATVNFVNQFLPVKAMFAAVGSAMPWFVLLVVAGIIWRWVKGL